jgi:K+-transporting ATPase c subunit
MTEQCIRNDRLPAKLPKEAQAAVIQIFKIAQKRTKIIQTMDQRIQKLGQQTSAIVLRLNAVQTVQCNQKVPNF